MKRLALITASIFLITVLLMQSTQTDAAIVSFGITANNASVQTNSQDRKYVYSATPTSGGMVVSGVARVWNGGTVSSNTNLVIYSSVSGSSSALLAVSDTLAVANGTSEAARAYTFSGANQITIASGTPYFIGVHFSDPGTGNFNISRANTPGLVWSDVDTYSDGPSNPCACNTVSNGGLDIYIEYDDAPAVSTSTPSLDGVWFD